MVCIFYFSSACFTPGAYLNNRTMMPCQEPPVAVATWQATVKVPRGFSVLSSGEAVTCMKKTKPETSVKEGKILLPFVNNHRQIPFVHS